MQEDQNAAYPDSGIFARKWKGQIHATAWVNLGKVVLNERNQKQKAADGGTLQLGVMKCSKSAVACVWDGGEWRLLASWVWFSFRGR